MLQMHIVMGFEGKLHSPGSKPQVVVVVLVVYGSPVNTLFIIKLKI